MQEDSGVDVGGRYWPFDTLWNSRLSDSFFLSKNFLPNIRNMRLDISHWSWI